MKIVLDAGALIAADKRDRHVLARLRAAHTRGDPLVTNPMVLGQVWRGSARQAVLSRLLHGVAIVNIDEATGKAAGELLGRSGTSDVVDASVILLSSEGDVILTTDAAELAHLAGAAELTVTIVSC